mmetsp:Transcript_20969/g.38959  ORF Transcript_20969/g.38959 Transcript_20969/m.38959 type:complete len:342 (+) Transcript_20969:69-1094(+)
MAIRVYVDPSGPPQPQQQMVIMQQQDPFAMMDEMMISPFGGMGGRRGPPGGLGGVFGMMDAMMNEMMGPMMMGGPGMMMGGPGGGMMIGGPGGMMMGGGEMMAMGMSGGDGAGFSCQTMMVSSQMGPDGQMHTERFASSSIGDPARQIQEVQQAYSNSSTGVDKMSLERQMAERARKVVKERDATTGEERSTELYRGMEEENNAEFDQQWTQTAAPYLPRHAGDVRMIMGPPQGQALAAPPQAQPLLAIQQGQALPSAMTNSRAVPVTRVAAAPAAALGAPAAVQPATVIRSQSSAAGAPYMNAPVSIRPGSNVVGGVQYASPPASTQYSSAPAGYYVQRR